MHSQIDKIVEGLVERKKYIYLCTNALLLKEKAPPVQAEQVFLTFSVHVDGRANTTIFRFAARAIRQAISGIKEAVKRAFRQRTEHDVVRRRRSEQRSLAFR